MTATSVPSVQRSIVQTRYGAARDVLALSEDMPVCAPGEQEVQVRVRASPINPIDWQMIEGNRRLVTRPRFPFTPLFDLAGVVTAVGDSVTPASAIGLLATITARRIRGSGARGVKYVPVFLGASGPLFVEGDDARVHIARTFPLTVEEVNAAIDESRPGRTVGKPVLTR
ncbi:MULTISPECIES: alcohol dehydrogenase catalytic domain-containing protein [Nocardiopsis]|uniref:alcohol dehydrogenase catalytic domain-containing protein n=1 Tax=Nocardiopsis TaxID=2013 RepID=UPI000988DCF7|nr:MULTISPECIES: alcohol dehydrogenase catalytic domain-containing protein [Nocardiopsis]